MALLEYATERVAEHSYRLQPSIKFEAWTLEAEISGLKAEARSRGLTSLVPIFVRLNRLHRAYLGST